MKINISDPQVEVTVYRTTRICVSSSPHFVSLSDLFAAFSKFRPRMGDARRIRRVILAQTSAVSPYTVSVVGAQWPRTVVQNTVYKARKCGGRKEADSICG